jgi:hypothetical protein
MIDRTKRWRGLVDAWEKSGLSQAEFCRRRGVKAVTFGWWKRKLKGVNKPARGFRLRGGSKARGCAEIVERGPAQFVEVALPRTVTAIESTSSAAFGRYEIALNGGRVIRLPHSFEPAVVVRLVTALESC